MSNNNSAFERISSQLKLGSTGNIFILFTIFFLVVSISFYFLSDRYQFAKSKRLVERTVYNSGVGEVIDQLEDEAQKSVKNSLYYGIFHKEIDRFETIYSLKATTSLLTKLSELTEPYHDIPAINDRLNSLSLLLSEFDGMIAESINDDGKFAEILDASLQQTDSTNGEFLFEEIAPIDESGDTNDSKIIEASFEQIQNELNLLENQMSILINKEIENISNESPYGIYVTYSLTAVGLLTLLAFLTIKNMKSSVDRLSHIFHNIAKGELPENEVSALGEFNRIADAGNRLIHYLDDAGQFAVKIGDGDFDYEFKPKSKEDALGNSLIDMRNRLLEVAREDKLRNWMNEGHAKFGDILRQHSDDIEKLGSVVITNLVEYLGASQGALFIIKGEGEDMYMELLSAYAYKRKKFIDKRIEIGEGLAGQAFAEGKTIFLTDIQTDHYDIQTGLGDSKPTALLIVPLKEDDRIEGIIEIASLKKIEKHQIEFVESIGESLASSLSAVKINQTTKKLLEETQEKAEQMKAQEEELRQNMEELAATQEQMERRNKEMEEIQEQLSEEKYLLNALLNSTHDRIYFKDKDSKFIRVSNSMIELFRKKDESEIIGKSDFDFGFGDHAKKAFDDEQTIIGTGKPLLDAVEKEKWDDGHLTWVSTTKNPLRDLDGKIIGTFGISRDITKNKLTELEMKKRKEWLENFFAFHPAGFIVLDQYGNVNFATKSILSQFDKDKVEGMVFEDIFSEISFESFLTEIDFENKKDKETEIEICLKGENKAKQTFLVVVGSDESEDGTLNIFLIQK